MTLANDTGGIPADGKSAHATNAAALDERITRLEAKLLDNQRDLHTLLQKIREFHACKPIPAKAIKIGPKIKPKPWLMRPNQSRTAPQPAITRGHGCDGHPDRPCRGHCLFSGDS